jgi:tRNA 2-selenouridine synthase
LKLIVIGGMTGSGKTGVLESLETLGKQVIHLERLAGHKGSVFGGIGMSSQPTTEQFENDLFTCIEQLNFSDPVFVEDESLAIGQVFLPKSFYEQMSGARFMNLLVPVNRRIHQLVNAYTGGEKELLIDGVKRIERRLGSETAARVISNIRNDEMTKAVELVLHYYDKVYARSMTMHNRKEVIEIEVAEENLEAMAEMVINLMYK